MVQEARVRVDSVDEEERRRVRERKTAHAVPVHEVLRVHAGPHVPPVHAAPHVPHVHNLPNAPAMIQTAPHVPHAHNHQLPTRTDVIQHEGLANTQPSAQTATVLVRPVSIEIAEQILEEQHRRDGKRDARGGRCKLTKREEDEIKKHVVKALHKAGGSRRAASRGKKCTKTNAEAYDRSNRRSGSREGSKRRRAKRSDSIDNAIADAVAAVRHRV
jgi:hypothetical protein